MWSYVTPHNNAQLNAIMRRGISEHHYHMWGSTPYFQLSWINLMNQLKKQGVGVLFVSSELPEVMGISDRIIVMCDGRITGELSPEEATEDRILQYATQFEAKI